MADNLAPSAVSGEAQNPAPQFPQSPAPDLPQSQQTQQQQSQQSLLNLQRSGSVPRMSQIQHQLGRQQQQHSGMNFSGQMSFGGGGQGQGQMPSQQQQQLVAAAGMSRSGMMMQAGQLQMLPGQAPGHFNISSGIMPQARQKGLLPGAQFHATNSSGQALQGMQQMGVMNTPGLNQQIRANGQLQYGQQRFPQGQLRQQQISQQSALASPQKVPSQNLPRASSVAALNQITGLTQNGQTVLMQSTLAQQPWLKNLQPSMGGSVSPSYHLPAQQRQQQALLQQLNSAQFQKSMPLTQQQISQLLQQQQHPQLGTQQQQQQILLQQQQQFQQMQQQQQLQSPRFPGSAAQKSLSLTGSQPETPASGTAMTGGSSSQGAEAANQLLGKRKIHDLVSQVDPFGRLEPEVEDFLLEIADEFIDSVTAFACNLAKHRKSSTLEAKDVLLHLEKNWHLTVPGFTREDNNYQRKSNPVDTHIRRLDIVRELVESQLSQRDQDGAKGSNKQVVNEAGTVRPVKPSQSSEHLSLSAVGSQMLQRVHRFS